MKQTSWHDEARALAAQCWCDDETKGIEMDSRLAEAFAKRLEAWMGTAAQAQRDAYYYKGLVIRVGQAIGEPAYIADDGTRSADVLCAKVPELAEELLAHRVARDGEILHLVKRPLLADVIRGLELARGYLSVVATEDGDEPDFLRKKLPEDKRHIDATLAELKRIGGSQ